MGYAGVVLEDSPLSFWRLNEASGTTAKDAVGGHAGTYAGTVSYSNAAIVLGDSSAASVKFDGSTTTVTSSAIAQGASNNPYSLEAWVYLTGALGGSAYNVISQEAAGGVVSCVYWTGTAWQFQHGTGSGFSQATFTTTPATSTPYHLLGVYDGAHAILYLNGVSVASVVATVSATTITGTRLGSFSNSGGIDFWPQRIAEAAVYNSALSAAHSLAHYNEGALRGGVVLG